MFQVPTFEVVSALSNYKVDFDIIEADGVRMKGLETWN